MTLDELKCIRWPFWFGIFMLVLALIAGWVIAMTLLAGIIGVAIMVVLVLFAIHVLWNGLKNWKSFWVNSD
ncbi:MAG: hypothetical protein K0S38_45 [Candidatus Paceibacter sp.]|jgi:hypothetical protein|nr:hypothetical protein [Candidatus Paceibacter sp.]